MGRRIPLFAYLIAVVGILVTGRPASADPVTLRVTDGVATITGLLSTGVVNVEGPDGFRLSGSTSGFAAASLCSPCLAGDSVSLSGNLSGLSGTAAYDGVEFVVGLIGGPAAVTFDAPTVLLPSLTSFAPWSIQVAFFAEGFTGAADPEGPRIQFFGSGTATATFGAFPQLPDGSSGTQFIFRSIVYDFDDADPTPEPSTMLLIGSGLAAGLLRRRLRSPKVH